MIEPLMRWRVAIADDHAVTRQGIRIMLELLGDVDIVGEAASGPEIVSICSALRPDVALMDINMPEVDGIEATRRVKDLCPEVAVVLLTVREDEVAIIEGFRAGASGYLSKSATLEEIGSMLRSLREGKGGVGPQVARQLISALSTNGNGTGGSVVRQLTGREREVLGLLGEGLSNRRIATQIGVSERTVTSHIGNLYRKMGVNNRVDAVREAMRVGLVSPPT